MIVVAVIQHFHDRQVEIELVCNLSISFSIYCLLRFWFETEQGLQQDVCNGCLKRKVNSFLNPTMPGTLERSIKRGLGV